MEMSKDKIQEVEDEKKFQTFKNFKLKRKIGKGRFSSVYQAKCTIDNSIYAVKKVVIPDYTDPVVCQKYLLEVKLLKSCHHHNIIRYFASFLVDDCVLFIICELADAGDLECMIKAFREKKIRIPERTIWKYFYPVASAVCYLHDRRIMHRDIKPSNIYVTGKGIVKLGDFGLGRAFGSGTLAASSWVGTPYYMSPERVAQRDYDFKSDIWSLGCLLYELAALRSPFFGAKLTLVQLCEKIEKADYQPLEAHLYSASLRQLVDKAIMIKPGDRPTASQVLREASHMYRESNSTTI